MVKLGHFYHKVENCFGLLIKLIKPLKDLLVDAHVFVSRLIVKMSFQEAPMVKFVSGTSENKQKLCNQLKKFTVTPLRQLKL